MQKGGIDGYRKRLQRIMEVQGLPGIDGSLGRFIGYTTTGSPTVTDQSLIHKGDWVVSQDGHVWVASAFFGGAWIWLDTFTQGMAGILTTKGDVVAGSGSGNFSRLAVGTTRGQALTADATETRGLIYANPRSGADVYLGRTNNKGETYSRALATGDTSASSGTLIVSAIYLPKNVTITNIGYKSGVTAAVLPTHWWFALLDNSSPPVYLRSTADQLTTAWGANTEKLVALSSTFTTLYEGLYYLGFMMTATTTVVSTWTMTAVAGSPSGSVPILTGSAGAGLTVPIADTTAASAITSGVNYRWAYVT